MATSILIVHELLGFKWAKKAAVRWFIKYIDREGLTNELARELVAPDGCRDWLRKRFAKWEFVAEFSHYDLGDSTLKLLEAITALKTVDTQIAHSLVVPGDGISPDRVPLHNALAILRKYNYPWSGRQLSYPHEIPEYVKGASNPFAEQIVSKALQTPYLYRLNFIKQLSTLHFRRHLDASHNRLPHAIGTAEAAALLLEAVERPLTENPIGKQNLTPQEKTAVVLYALIHDLHHGPMGHSLEFMRDVLGVTIQRVDKHFLQCSLDYGDELAILVKKVAGGTDADQIIALIKFLDSRDDRFPDFSQKYFLTEIVDSILDADRFDFLLRDALHLGRPRMDKNRWIDVLMSARVVEEPEPHPPHYSEPRKMIAYSSLYSDRIDEILSLRSRFYREFYEDRDRVALDEMVCHAIYYAFEEIGLIRIHPDDANLKESIVTEFMKLTSDTLFSFLMDLQASLGEDRVWYILDMVRDILTNRHFRPIVVIDTDRAETDKMLLQWKKFSDAVESEWNRLAKTPHAHTKQVEQDRRERIKELYRKNPIDREALLFMFAVQYCDSFASKLIIEKKLWQAVLSYQEIEEAWLGIVDKNYGTRASKLIPKLRDKPQIHITVPSHIRCLRQGTSPLCPRGFQDTQDIREEGKPKVLCYDTQGIPYWHSPDISHPQNAPLEFQAILSAQFDLVTSEQRIANRLNEIAEAEFTKLIGSLDWFLTSSPD